MRRIGAGVALIGFPLAGVISSVFDANEGTGMPGADLYTIAAAHHAAIMTAAVIFLLSAILTVPVIAGLLHLLPGRGAVMGYIGGAFALVGAFGHMGYGIWQMMLARIPEDSDRAAMIAYLDRSSVVTDALLPMLLAIVVGIVLVTFALYRARFAPLWVPLVVLAAVIAEIGLDSTAAGESKWLPVVIWAAALIAFGYLGARVLAMSDDEWTHPRDIEEAPAYRAQQATTTP
jgi:hypothetical protein